VSLSLRISAAVALGGALAGCGQLAGLSSYTDGEQAADAAVLPGAHPAQEAGSDATAHPDASGGSDAREAGNDTSVVADAMEGSADAAIGDDAEESPEASAPGVDAAGGDAEAGTSDCAPSCPVSAASGYSCAAGGCNAAGGTCSGATAQCYCTSNSQCASGACAGVSGQNDVSCGTSCTTTAAAHDGFDCVLASPGIPAACEVSTFGYVPSNVNTSSTPMATLAAQIPSTGTTVSTSFTYQPPTANGPASANGGTWASGTPPYVFVYQAQASAGPDVDILVFQTLTVSSGVTLTIGGLRPVIFLVFGNASIAGTISANGYAGALNTFGTDAATPFDNPANVDNVFDGNAATYWTSDTYTTASNNTEWLAFWWPDVPLQITRPTSYLYLTPHYSGTTPLGFPVTFDIYYSNPSSWVLATTYTNYHVPSAGGPVVLPLSGTYFANGIQIVASTLGADSGHYDISFAEVQAGADPTGPGGDYNCGASAGGNGNDANTNPPYDRNTGGGGGGASGAGGTGGNDGTGGGGTAGSARANANIVPLYGGCPGGISGTCGGTQFGGGGGGAVQISAAGTLTVTGSVSAVGGAGGTSSNQTCNGSAYVGGAGGGSGGAVLLEGNSVTAPLASTPVNGGPGGVSQTTSGGAGGTSGTPTGANGAHASSSGSGGGGGYGYLKTNAGAAPTYACITVLSPAPACGGDSTCLCVADSDCPSGHCSDANSQCTGTCSGSMTAGTYDGADCALVTPAPSAWSCSAGTCSNVTSANGACGDAGIPCWCTADAQCSGGLCVDWAGCPDGACTGSGAPDGFHCRP
jgi:hypothetical protein